MCLERAKGMDLRMKMIKIPFTGKILSTLLVLSMLFVLTACGSPASSSSQPAAPSSSAAPTAETKTLKIGVLGNETGWFSVMDLNNIYEIKAYAAVINEEGGADIGGTKYKIDLDVADGKSDNEGIRSGAIKLSDDGCKYVIETNDFWVVGAQDIFEQSGLMHINSYCVGVPDFAGPKNPHAFTGMNGVIGDYVTTFEALKKNYPNVKSLVLVCDDNGNIPGMIALLKSLSTKYGITVQDNAIVFPGSTVDVTAIASKLKATDADAFITQGSMTTIGGIVKELRNSGSNMVAAMAVGQPASSFIKVAGTDAATNAFTLGVSPDKKDNTPIMNKIRARVAKDYGQGVADNWTGNFANCLYELLYIMNKAGSVDVNAVMKEWTSLDTVDTIYGPGHTGGDNTYKLAKHAISVPTPISIIDNGKFRFGGWITPTIP